jgi:DNA-binding phage protein
VELQHREGERVEQIFALKLLIERGYDNIPLSLIAKKAGLSKAGLYHHFLKQGTPYHGFPSWP